MFLDLIIGAAFLVIDPNGATSLWKDEKPNASQVRTGAKILLLPADYGKYDLDKFVDNGDGTAKYQAPKADTPLPVPDGAGFINAINADSLVAGQPLLFQLGSNLLPIFQNDMSSANIPALQQHWLDAKKVFGEDWLTPDVQKMIGGYALKYHIPLE